VHSPLIPFRTRQNNDPRNLQVLSRAEHARLHRMIDINDRQRDAKGRLMGRAMPECAD
jgi:hypothetical protein